MVIRLALMFLLMAGAARAETLRLIVPETRPVVGELIPVTVRGEYTRLITLEKLTFPDSPDYDWIQVSRDAWTDERIGGRTVRVFERRLAVFARRPGPLVIGPVVHRLTVGDGATPREPLDVEADPVTLAIAPYPGEGAPLTASSLTLEESLSAAPGELRDGETLVRRVTIRAEGSLPHQVPPRPAMREPWLITFAAPESRTVRPIPGPVTTVTWEWHLRPKTGEPGVLPAVEIPWFDTVARRMRIAEIPAIPFGYGSFRDNRGGAEALPAAQAGLAAAAGAAGLLVGATVLLFGGTRRRADDLVRIMHRLSPVDPTRSALKRAARSGDLLTFRGAAERYLRRRRETGLPVTGRETARLDEALYSRTGDPAGLDLTDGLRQVLDHSGSRPPARR